MALMLEKDQSFSLSAYVTSPGYQSLVLSGYIYEDRPDGRYVAPIIPELFYGANGSQLQGTWRQYLPNTGDQVVLSRGAGDNPHVPKSELWWRKVADYTNERRNSVAGQVYQPTPDWSAYFPWIMGTVALVAIAGFTVYLLQHPP